MAFLHNASLNQLSDGGFVLRGEPMSNMAMLELLKDMSHTDFTVQGIRSTSKTWCEEETNLSNQAVEFCIAHLPGDEAEKAYRRRSMLAKRKQIMESWAAFAAKQKAKVISIKTGVAA